MSSWKIPIAVWVCAVSIGVLGANAGELSVTDAEVAAERDRLAAAGFSLWIERQLRLTGVDARLRASNADRCGSERIAITGIVARTAGDLPRAFRDVAYRRMGVDDFLTVLAIAPGHAGDRAGVRAGDAILRVNGAETHSARSLDARADGDDTLTLQIARDGRVFDLELPPSSGCPGPAEYLAFDTIDLYREDDRVVVCAGLLRFIDSDDDLAVLLGHELAHALLDETATETDADRLGLEITARAGFSVAGAAALSRRIEREFPIGAADRAGYSHPVSRERWDAMTLIAAAIERDREPR